MNKPLHVVSVKMGEIYSGYTFSSAKDFAYDPMHITSYEGWTSLFREGIHLQIPMSILLNAERGFESFGFEAEDQYMSLSENGNESDVYFFQHFLCQPKWFKETVNSEILVKSSNLMGAVPLKTLLSHSVRYLKTHHLKQTNILRDLEENEIMYVVLYPDEIKFDARFLLFESFLNTGISQKNVVLVEESYAIQTFARHIEKQKNEKCDGLYKESIIILNCTLTQVCPKVAFYDCPMGTTSVIGTSSIINDIESILTKQVGCSLIGGITDNYSRSELYDNFDLSLRDKNLKQYCTIKISASCINNIKNHITSSWNKGFQLFKGNLRIDKTVIYEVFQNALKPLIDHLKREINILDSGVICKVVLVGDFSRYVMTEAVLQDSFPQYKIIVPSGSEMADLIGATISGHEMRSKKYEKLVQYVPKMPIVGTSHIELTAMGSSSHLNKMINEKYAVKSNACTDTTAITETVSTLSFLPDPIRPSKIAAKLQDLYDVEYAESLAFCLEKGSDESTSERFLLQILNEAYDECRKQAHAQINTITQVFHPIVGIDDIKTSLPPDVVKPLIEYRRKNALQFLPRLIKSFIETLPNKINISNAQLSICASFIEKSMECCWLMSVTEPQMFLKFEWNKSEQIDLDELEIERGDGKYVVNMRWPTLYLHENGPLMNKGVVNAN